MQIMTLGVFNHDDSMTSWHGDVMSVTSQRHDGEPRDKILLQTRGRPSPKVDCSRLNHTMIIL